MILMQPALLNAVQYIAIAVGVINISLLLGLFYIYWNSYRKIKSEFTIGLMYFSLFLLAQNVLATLILLKLLMTGAGTHDPEGMEHLFELSAINLIQLVALSILSKITW